MENDPVVIACSHLIDLQWHPTSRVSSRNFILVEGGELTDHMAIRPWRGEGARGGCVPSCVEREAKKY